MDGGKGRGRQRSVVWCISVCSTRIGEGGLEDVESVTSNTITAHAISQQGIVAHIRSGCSFWLMGSNDDDYDDDGSP